MATNGYHHEGANGHSNGCSGPSTEHSASSKSNQVPVAICGMGMRLPGGIHNASDLYDFLANKGDARSVIGGDRYNVNAYYDPHGKHGTINTKHGYFLSDVDFSMFDLSMFTLTAAEAEQVDPNHRLVLEVVREAFESAGETEWRGKNIGTYVGKILPFDLLCGGSLFMYAATINVLKCPRHHQSPLSTFHCAIITIRR